MSLIQLRYQGSAATQSRLFDCIYGDQSLVVVPRELYNKKDKPGIPVTIEGVPYVIWTVYNLLSRDYEMFLYAAEGPYQGFKGPAVQSHVIEVTQEVFEKYFNLCAWRRTEKGDVMTVQYPCSDHTAITLAVQRGYVLQHPGELPGSDIHA